MESARVRDFHTSWCSIWNRTSECSERVRFPILHQRVWKSRTKRFPWCNLFILYILRFSHPQKIYPSSCKFELYEQLEYTENIILSKLPDKATRNDRENTIRLNYGLWLDETIFHVWETRFASLIGRSKIRNAFSYSNIWCKNLSILIKIKTTSLAGCMQITSKGGVAFKRNMRCDFSKLTVGS